MSESSFIPLLQSAQFARCASLLDLAVQRHEAPGLCWQVQSRHLPFIGAVDLISRGPVASCPQALENWLRGMAALQVKRPLIINADGPTPKALRAAGFWPLITPATLALLDLGEPDAMFAAMYQKWRNRLRRARKADLQIHIHDLSGAHWLLQAEHEQMQKRGYRGLPPALWQSYAQVNPGQAKIFEARHGGDAVAAALILRHGTMATWQIGHSTPEGRRRNAMNLVLWNAMTWLADRGHRMLDLGGINHEDAPGLAHFKLGCGARAHRLGGTWLYQRSLVSLARHLPLSFAA